MNQATKRLRPTSTKTRGNLMAFWLLLGWAGGHRLYLGHGLHGAFLMMITLATCGLGGILGFIDGAWLFFSQPKDAHGLPVMHGKPIYVDDVEAHALMPGDAIAHLLFHLGV